MCLFVLLPKNPPFDVLRSPLNRTIQTLVIIAVATRALVYL